MSPSVLRLPENKVGRDFVVGDIHGAFDLVWEAMKQVSFNRETDRLFCIGDLIDRGPESVRCVEFLQQPYVHSVRGNHEDMLLQMHRDGEPPAAVVDFMVRRNGFGWWLTTPNKRKQEVLEAVAKLPIAIEVDTPRGGVGFIHAEVPAGMMWHTFTEHIEAQDAATIETALTGRDRIEAGDRRGVRGIGRVFVGHTPHWGGLHRYGNVYAIDTGAIFGDLCIKEEGCLTVAEIAATTAIFDEPPRKLAMIDAREGVITTQPFGNYAE